MEEVQYLDWNNSIQTINKAYESGFFVLIIGPKGTGKTSLVRDFAKSIRNQSRINKFQPQNKRESSQLAPKPSHDGTVSLDEGSVD